MTPPEEQEEHICEQAADGGCRSLYGYAWNLPVYAAGHGASCGWAENSLGHADDGNDWMESQEGDGTGFVVDPSLHDEGLFREDK